MSLPLFFPNVKYVKSIDRSGAITLEQLCEKAQTRCQAIGRWTQRPVVISKASDSPPWVNAEPGDWATVEIGVPPLGNDVKEARWALGVLAFVIFDGVARASVHGQEWARIEKPRGPSPTGRALSNAERQRKFRSRHIGQPG